MLQIAQGSELYNRGISDDKFVGGQGFVADCEDIDIRTSIKGITLDKNRELTYTITMTDTDEPIIANIDSWSFAGRSILTRANTYMTERFYNTNSDDYLNAITIGEYKVGITKGYINRFTTLTSQAVNDVEERYIDLNGSSSTVTYGPISDYEFGRPVLYSQDMLYVGGGGTVDRIDVSNDAWYLVNTLNTIGDVRGISEIGGYYHVYSTDGINTWKYIRDGVSSNADYIYKWAGNAVFNIANMGDFDYVIAGSNNFRRMYYCSGTTFTMMYGSEFIQYDEQILNFKPMYINSIETLHNRVFFAGKDVFYVYGNKKASDKPSLTKQFKIENCDEINSIYFIDDDSVLITYMYNKVAKAIFMATSEGNYSKSGYIETLAYDGGIIETTKQPNRIITGYKLGVLGDDTTSIDVYARIDTDKYRVFRNFSSTPTVGDTYTGDSGATYTVLETNDTEIICTRDVNGDYYYESQDDELTKVTGSGATTITYDTVDNHIFVGSITDTTKTKNTMEFKKEYNYIQLKYVLKTDDLRITPTLYSDKILFTLNNLDNGYDN